MNSISKSIWILFSGLSLWFFACTGTENKQHERLIGSSHTFLFEDGEHADEYYNDRLEFIKPYNSEKHVGDTLFITTLRRVNSCAETQGDIQINGDSIILLDYQIGDIACASTDFHKFEYVVFVPQDSNYIISY